MQCGAARKYLYRLDEPDSEEVSFPTQAEVVEARAHVGRCAACQGFFAAEERLKVFLRSRAPRDQASAVLRERVLTQIAQERERSAKVSHWFERVRRRGVALAVVGVLATTALLAGLWLTQRRAPVTPQQLASILIADHAGSLPGVTEITSSDREVVQTWFRERVGFSFHLPPTSDPRLIGGRLCHLQGQRAALIFYQHPQSIVSLFILDGSHIEWPDNQLISLDGKRCLATAGKGYNAVLWEERGLLYGLVSDAPSADLLQLAGKF